MTLFFEYPYIGGTNIIGGFCDSHGNLLPQRLWSQEVRSVISFRVGNHLESKIVHAKIGDQFSKSSRRQQLFVIVISFSSGSKVDVCEGLWNHRKEGKHVMWLNKAEPVMGGKITYSSFFEEPVNFIDQFSWIRHMLVDVSACHNIKAFRRKVRVHRVSNVVLLVM